MASTWVETTKPKKYPALDKDIAVDAAIIGGGISGITAAYLLSKAGAKVVLIDKGRLSESVTAYTTAFARYVADTSSLVELRDLFGDDVARTVWESGREAVRMIGDHVKEEGIECEYARCDFHKIANDKKEWKELAAEADLAGKYGFNVQKNPAAIQPANFGHFTVGDQAKFHPLKYLDALRAKAVADGALVFENTEAREISRKNPAVIETPGGKIKARHVFVATYSPFNDPRQLFAHTGTYTTYVLELAVPAGLLVEEMYEDGMNPYHYWRVDRMPSGRDRVIIGGEDHRKELPFDPRRAYSALEDYFQKILPGVEYEVVRKWSGPILETVDGLPYIGPYDEEDPGLFVATGFSGSGMTFGTMSGHMFARFAEGHPTPWKEAYDPLRKITFNRFMAKGRDYVKELINGYVKNVFRGPG